MDLAEHDNYVTKAVGSVRVLEGLGVGFGVEGIVECQSKFCIE